MSIVKIAVRASIKSLEYLNRKAWTYILRSLDIAGNSEPMPFAVSATTNLFGFICRTLNPELEYLNRVARALFLFTDLDNALPRQPLFYIRFV